MIIIFIINKVTYTYWVVKDCVLEWINSWSWNENFSVDGEKKCVWMNVRKQIERFHFITIIDYDFMRLWLSNVLNWRKRFVKRILFEIFVDVVKVFCPFTCLKNWAEKKSHIETHTSLFILFHSINETNQWSCNSSQMIIIQFRI